MKYINLLPPELQTKSTVAQRKTKPFPKALLGCLVVPALIILTSFIAIIVIKHHYKEKASAFKNQKVPTPVAKTEVAVVTARPIKRRQAVPKKQPQPSPEKTVSVVTRPKPQTHQSNAVRKKADGYTLHVESFATKDEAEALVREMMEQKLEPYQQSKQVLKSVNTIYVGQASSMEEAMELTHQLEAYGYEAFIKIRPQGTNWIGIKGFSTQAKSQELSRQLLNLGYSAEVVPEQVSLTIYRVNLGHYKEYRQAKATQNQLEKLGYRFSSIIRE